MGGGEEIIPATLETEPLVPPSEIVADIEPTVVIDNELIVGDAVIARGVPLDPVPAIE